MSLRGFAIAAATITSISLTVAGCHPRQPADHGGGHAEPVLASGDIEVPGMFADVEAFRAWRDQVAVTPRGGAAAFVVAMMAYSANPETGAAWLTVQTDRKFLSDASKSRGPQGYKGMRVQPIDMRRHKDRLAAKPYIARSYVLGTSPGNKYSIPPGPFVISTRREVDAGNGRVKVFVHSTGADSDRPMVLQQNDRGIWKAYSWSSLQVGVRPPAQAAVKDDF